MYPPRTRRGQGEEIAMTTTTTITAATVDALIGDAIAAYDRAATAWTYARTAATTVAALPMREGECPCGCERQSADMAVERTDQVCNDLANLVRTLRELRDSAQ
jgi:hypothetical protein